MIYRIDVEVVAPVFPTEDPDRVVAAIKEIFPTAELERSTGEVVGRSHSIDRFASLLEKQRIRDTGRKALLESIEGDTISFALHKQAAYAGTLNFALEDPAELGDIHVSIRVDQPDPRHLIESMTRTEESEA